MFSTKFHAVTKWSQIHPNTMKRIETLVLGPMGSIGCVRCEKSWRDFVAQTFALIALAHPVLHRVSCSYEMIPNAPKHYQTDETWVKGPMGWIGCVRCEKFRHAFVAQTFALIALVQLILLRVSCSNEMIPNAQNITKHTKTWFRVQWGGSGAFVVKNSDTTSWHKLLH